ncbi:MAG: adenylyltransferase/cytidyltransferase family protein, partial [Candidatus Saccharimonadales bacterium]
MKLRRVGIYPGTFDPVHPGHIAFALEALRACQLDEIVFMPEQSPREKQNVTGLAQRVMLLEQTVAATNGLRVMQLDANRFTVAGTLPELRRLFPGTELTLLIGSDVVRTFLYRWEGLDVLLNEVRLVIGMRTGDMPDEMTAIIQQLAKAYDIAISHTIVHTEQAHMAS